MASKHARPSASPVPTDVTPPTVTLAKSGTVKALTVNVPVAVLNLAKTRASLEGATLSSIVTEALGNYAEGLRGVLTALGLDKSRE